MTMFLTIVFRLYVHVVYERLNEDILSDDHWLFRLTEEGRKTGHGIYLVKNANPSSK